MTKMRGDVTSDEARRDQLAIVARVAVGLSRTNEIDELCDLTMDSLLEVLPIDRASLLLFDQDDVMRFVAWRGLSSAYRQAVDRHSPWLPDTTDAKPIAISDVMIDNDLEPFRDTILSEGIRALAFIPLGSTGGLIGKAMLYVNEPHHFEEGDLNLAWAIATQLAIAIDRSRSEQVRESLLGELRKERNTLSFLSKASELLTSSLDPDSILGTIALLAVPTMADWCVIDLLDEEGSLRRVAVAHRDLDKVRWAQEFQEKYPPSSEPEQSAVARVIRSGAPELYETVTDEMLRQAANDEEHLRVLHNLGMRSAMIVPLTARGNKIGAITFVSCESLRTFDSDDVSLATDLAQRAALAVDNARLYEKERNARQGAEHNAERIARLQEVTAALSEAITPARVADVIIELGIRAFDARAGAVALKKDDRAELIRTIGFDQEYIRQFQTLSLDDPDRMVPITKAILSGEPLLIPNEETLVRDFPFLRGRTTGAHQAFAAIPLSLDDHTFGAISLSFSAARVFSPEDRDFLLALARTCAQALDRARLYESEHRAREEAERANRAKDEFLATLSHEMRTPLTSALGWARMLVRGELDPEAQRHAVEAIYRSTQSQVRIVEDLLDVSRIIAGKMTIRREPVDLAELVAGAVELLSAHADQQGVQLKVDLESIPVLGDEERLRQVFWNLLSNAIKFSSDGGTVRVTMHRSAPTATVEILDDGRGIEPEFIPHLFERFRQADSSTTRSFGGLGLGLSIVQYLVHLHGGNVRASSEGRGKGAVFTVELPLIADGKSGPEETPRT